MIDSPHTYTKIHNTRCVFPPTNELIKGYTVGKISWCGTGWNQSAPPYNRAPFQVHWLRHTAELNIGKGKQKMPDIFITKITLFFIFMPKSIVCPDNGWAQAPQMKKHIHLFFLVPANMWSSADGCTIFFCSIFSPVCQTGKQNGSVLLKKYLCVLTKRTVNIN